MLLADTPEDLRSELLTAGFTALLGLLTWVGIYFKNKNARKAVESEKKARDEKLDTLVAEVATNGGEKSLKDFVHLMRADIKSMVVKQDKCIQDVCSLHEKTDSIQKQIDILNAQGRARTELALDQSNIPQFLANERGEVDYVNDAMAELFGLGKNHCMKNKWMVAIDDQKSREEIVTRLKFALERSFLFSFETLIRNQKTAAITLVRFTVEPRTDSNGMFLWNLGKFKEVIKN